MKILGLYGSPRAGGNSDQLLDQALAAAKAQGAEVSRLYARELRLAGCRECGGCDLTGECVQEDEMQRIYPLLVSSEAIIISTPMFFYAMPSQLKALVDRAQAAWNRRRLLKSPEQRKLYESGKGYLIAVGATRGRNLFDGVQLTARYFFDALDKSYEGGLFLRGLEGKDALKAHPEFLGRARELGEAVVRGEKFVWPDGV